MTRLDAGQSVHAITCSACRCGPDSSVRKLLRCICACHEGPPLTTAQTKRAVAILGNGSALARAER